MDDMPEPMSMGEFPEESEKRGEILAKQCYVEDDSIIINLGHEYPIALRRCATPEAILGWVDHLLDKTWMTTDVIQQFIGYATQHHGIRIHPLPG